jgi:GGDEF domain-containing protein
VTDGSSSARAAHPTVDPREGRLRFVLGGVPDIYRPQPIDDLLAHLLRMGATLAGAPDGFIAAISDEFLLGSRSTVEGLAGLSEPVVPADTPLLLRATRGVAQKGAPISAVPQGLRDTVLRAIFRNQAVSEPGAVGIPLRLGLHPMGALALSVPDRLDAERVELLELLVAQGAAAIQNLVLYAADSGFVPAGYRYLTLQRLIHALRMSHRRAEACAVVWAEVADMPALTRAHGARAAEWVRHHWANTLRSAVRDTDTVGRFSADAFLLMLPATPAQGAEVLVRRLSGASRKMTAGPVEVDYEARLGIAALPGLTAAPERIGAAAFMRLADDVVEAARSAAQDGTGVVRCSWEAVAP